jgi:hypothetical protein
MAHFIFTLDSGLHIQAPTAKMAELGDCRDRRGPIRHFFRIGHLARRKLGFRYLGRAAWHLSGELGLIQALAEGISGSHGGGEERRLPRFSDVLHFQFGEFCMDLFQGE